LTLDDAMVKGYITVTTRGLNGHTVICIEMEIKSLHKKGLKLTIESGLQLHSIDSTIQDMIITKGIEVNLESKQAKRVKVFANCIQRSNNSPGKDELFSLGFLADSNLLKLVKFIEKKRYYKDDAAQHAIWVLTDAGNIANIYSENEVVGKNLRLFMQQLTGRIAPWYQIEYKKEEGIVFTNEPAIIHATFKYTLEQDGVVTFAIYNEKGEVVQSILDQQSQKRGIQMMKIRFEANAVKPGNYYIRVHNKDQLIEERMLTF